ncbi:hypothetical protein JYU17_00565 [Flavobacteriaceae bacterium AH-315-O20]|nr:hypothetical protein [Flavobacteriaceae bacterium AH-315-O20]
MVAISRFEEAKFVLEKFGTDGGNVSEEIEEIKASLVSEMNASSEHLLSKIFMNKV